MTFPAEEQRLFITGPAGQIEAIATPAKSDAGQACAVVCHPHPQMQGTMNNKVVTTLARLYTNNGMPVLRFNYRGVEQSAGSYGEGRGELEDTLAMLQWMQIQFPHRHMYLAGFSFGGAIAYQAASRFAIKQLITVAPSVVHFNLYQEQEPACAWQLIQGEKDEVVPTADVLAWAKSREHVPDIITVPDCGHFFHGKLTILRDELQQCLP